MRLTYLILALMMVGVSPSYAEMCSTPYNKVFACPKDSPHAGEFYCSWVTPCTHDGVDGFVKEYTCLVPSAKSGCPSIQSCLKAPDCSSPKEAKHSERGDSARDVQQCRAKVSGPSVCVLPPSGWRAWN